VPLLLIIVTISIYTTNCQSEVVAQQGLSYDTAYIAIIPFNVKYFYGELDKTNTPSALTQDDLSEVEKIFKQSLSEHDSEIFGNRNNPNPVKNELIYKRQYVCYLNKAGEKIVYVDCFCSSMDVDWHKQMMVVDDGGKCFFNLKINLKTKKYFDFMVNGSA